MQIINSGIGLAYPSAFKSLYPLTSHTETIVPPNLLVPTSPILSRMSPPQTLALSLDEICLCLISSRAASISLLSTLSPINCMLQCCHEAQAVGGPSRQSNFPPKLLIRTAAVSRSTVAVSTSLLNVKGPQALRHLGDLCCKSGQ